MKIIFLDFDGVISTNRAWLAQKHIDHHDLRWLDPVACSMLRDICAKFNYTIVVTSTWRNFGMERIAAVLGVHGLWQFTHRDWRTGEIWPKGPNGSAGSRPAEIADWIERNGPIDDYVILDDDSFNWLPEQRAKWIKTDGLNGFSTENFETFMNINGEDDDPIQTPSILAKVWERE